MLIKNLSKELRVTGSAGHSLAVPRVLAGTNAANVARLGLPRTPLSNIVKAVKPVRPKRYRVVSGSIPVVAIVTMMMVGRNTMMVPTIHVDAKPVVGAPVVNAHLTKTR
jgi:hypothetical protein